MAEQARYVAVVEKENRVEETYVFGGNSTLDEILSFIDDRRILGGRLHGISVHRDESGQPSMVEILANNPGLLGLLCSLHSTTIPELVRRSWAQRLGDDDRTSANIEETPLRGFQARFVHLPILRAASSKYHSAM